MIKRYFIRNKFNIIFSLAAIIFMWLVWLVAHYIAGNELIVPSVGETFKSFFGYLGDGAFYTAVFNSLMRTLAAFLLSAVIAALCAAAAVLSKCARAFINPIMIFVRTLPTLAVLLIILKLTTGNRALSPVIVTVLVLFPMIYAQFIAAAEDVDAGLAEMAKVYSVKKRDRLLKIYLPLAAPNLVSQTGANISLGLKIMISAEVLASTAKGLGGMMQLCNVAAEIADLAALTIAAVLLGVVVELVFAVVRKLAFKWNKSGI